MPGVSFKPRFQVPIVVGDKRHTIRNRKRPFRPGDGLFLWIQQRTPNRRWLGYTTVRATQEVWIDVGVGRRLLIDVDGQRLDNSEADRLARADGFHDIGEMYDFWQENNEMPFKGQIVHWFYPLQERPAALKPGRKKGSKRR